MKFCHLLILKSFLYMDKKMLLTDPINAFCSMLSIKNSKHYIQVRVIYFFSKDALNWSVSDSKNI